MVETVRTGFWIPALVAITALGCVIGPREVLSDDAPQEVADIYCEQMFECDCPEGRLFADRGECRNSTRDRIQAVFDAAADVESSLDTELLYDATCLGDFVGTVEGLGCDSATNDDDDCEPPCNIFHGTRQLGESCSTFDQGFTDCAKGLACAGTCFAPCGGAAEVGQSCASRPCNEGLFCDASDACVELPGAGEPCTGRCDEGSFCGTPDPMNPAVSECIPLAADGQPCMGHLECASGHCPVGSCAPLPGQDEACPADLCADGLSCVNEMCVRGGAAICLLSAP